MAITTTLKLYTGTTPNTDGVHVYPTAHDSKTAFENYVTYLAPKLLTSVTVDNYRINALVIKVALSQTLNLTNYKDVTYAIHDLDKTCYYVKSAVVQSAYVIYDVEVDYWGTYIASATFDNINVLRCNRKVGVGLYDQIRATNTFTEARYPTPSGHYPTGYPAYYDIWRVHIVFCLNYNVEQSSTRAITASDMYAIRVETLYNAYKTWVDAHTPSGQTPTYLNPIEVAVGMIAGIYGVDASTVLWPTTNDAKVVKAYLLSDELVYQTGQVDFTVKSKSMYGNYDITPDYVSRVPRFLSIAQDIDPDYNYYVGTPNRGLKLVRTTEAQATVTYKCTIHQNDIEVLVMQGDNQLDLTSEFEVVLTLNSGDITNLAGIKQVLSTGVKGALSVGTMGLAGITSLAPDVINMLGQHFQGTQIGRGDGVNSFKKNGNVALGLGAQYPYGYTKCKSINDEQTNAQRKGAFFDAYVPTIDAIFTYPLIIGSAGATYIQANVAISTLPETAQSVIKQRLGQGIILIKV